jgi:hypothetical protein
MYNEYIHIKKEVSLPHPVHVDVYIVLGLFYYHLSFAVLYNISKRWWL